MSNYLSTPEAAVHLGVSISWLEKTRVHGDGPVFVKFKRSVRYRIEDLDAYAEANRRQSTTEGRRGAR